MNAVLSVDPKKQASALMKRLQAVGVDIKLTQAYEGVAAIHGHQDWNRYAAFLEKKPLTLTKPIHRELDTMLRRQMHHRIPGSLIDSVLATKAFSEYREHFSLPRHDPDLESVGLDLRKVQLSSANLSNLLDTLSDFLLSATSEELEVYVFRMKPLVLCSTAWELSAIHLLGMIIKAMRSLKGSPLDQSDLHSLLEVIAFDECERLAWKDGVDFESAKGLRLYYFGLPGYEGTHVSSEKAMAHHKMISMQLSYFFSGKG